MGRHVYEVVASQGPVDLVILNKVKELTRIGEPSVIHVQGIGKSYHFPKEMMKYCSFLLVVFLRDAFNDEELLTFGQVLTLTDGSVCWTPVINQAVLV